jgi:galactokinase
VDAEEVTRDRLCDAARAAFSASHSQHATHVGFAGGRVNLIGDHVDYAGGCVLPMSLALGTVAVVAESRDGVDRVVSTDATHDARAYALGVVAELRADLAGEGVTLAPLSIAVASDLPVGAGLSSSAALEVSVARAVLALAGVGWSPARIALLCQRAEHVHARVPCGIMDQWCVSHAAPGEAIHLDCAGLRHEQCALPRGLTIEIVDSGVRHALRDGGYASRRADVERAAAELGVPLLADCEGLDESRLAALAQRVGGTAGERVARRARHVVGECARVARAAESLRAGDLDGFGELLTESHASLRDDFDVSVPELDRIVADACAAGALGARMTGGGFGGCAVVAWRGRRPEALKPVVASIFTGD